MQDSLPNSIPLTQLQNNLPSSMQITPAQLRSSLTSSNIFLQHGWRRPWQDLIHYCSTSAGQSVKCYTNHTAAEQPVQFYTNHTSTAAEHPDKVKCIPTAWLEGYLVNKSHQHGCRRACSVLNKSHQCSCGATWQVQMYSYGMVGEGPGNT